MSNEVRGINELHQGAHAVASLADAFDRKRWCNWKDCTAHYSMVVVRIGEMVLFLCAEHATALQVDLEDLREGVDNVVRARASVIEQHAVQPLCPACKVTGGHHPNCYRFGVAQAARVEERAARMELVRAAKAVIDCEDPALCDRLDDLRAALESIK